MQSWSFNRSLIVFFKVSDHGEVDDDSFNVCSFWVQMHGIPTLWMTEEIVGY